MIARWRLQGVIMDVILSKSKNTFYCNCNCFTKIHSELIKSRAMFSFVDFLQSVHNLRPSFGNNAVNSAVVST